MYAPSRMRTKKPSPDPSYKRAAPEKDGIRRFSHRVLRGEKEAVRT
jgi:hypothetical protein